ncbi:MAG: hypothetical protein KJP23_26370, partial [Deltaproteobacteria bacterium]|nr:hypothetical protein [Deltaproteobacteria bacterium]
SATRMDSRRGEMIQELKVSGFQVSGERQKAEGGWWKVEGASGKVEVGRWNNSNAEVGRRKAERRISNRRISNDEGQRMESLREIFFITDRIHSFDVRCWTFISFFLD